MIHLENVYIYKGWECDVFMVDRNLYSEEFEVKRSRADFQADLGLKTDKHHRTSNGQGANRFWFVCPQDMIYVDEVPEYAGLYYVIEKGMQKWLTCKKKAPKLHNNKIDNSLWEIMALKLYDKHA